MSWVGPVGPTRGKARVYIDGKLAETVNTWASSFRATRVLFQKQWDATGSHRIDILVAGTDGHPTVAIDAFLVRVDPGLDEALLDDGGQPIPTPEPVDPAAPAPTGAPMPQPTAAPTATPTVVPTAMPTATFTPTPTATPARTATPAPTPMPTPMPTAQPAVTPAPTPTPAVTPAPTPTPSATPTPTPTATPPVDRSVRVTTIPALLTSLADNAVDEIVVANGTYRVSPASSPGVQLALDRLAVRGTHPSCHRACRDPRRRHL